jgi:hypothetical protein
MLKSKDLGTIQVLLQRLNDERLPIALELKDKVDRGECLDDFDVRFLQQVFADASGAQRLVAKHSDLQPLLTRVVALYAEITDKALENERNRPH